MMMNFSFTSEIQRHKKSLNRGINFIGKYWFQGILMFFAMQLFFNRNFSIQVNMHAIEMEEVDTKNLNKPVRYFENNEAQAVAKPVKQIIKNQPKSAPKAAPKETLAIAGFSAAKPQKKEWKVSDFANLTFVLNPNKPERENIPYAIVDIKNDVCHKYVERFAKIAIAEMKKYKIPASITLAQGLLESNAGHSKLTQQSNNHFGIKCKAKCLGCTCRNYRDDDIYDMFRVFESSWESYREHSVLLSNNRYKHLKKLGTKDYKNWAHGLKKAGYATDKQYAEKLIMIIESLDLYQFDS